MSTIGKKSVPQTFSSASENDEKRKISETSDKRPKSFKIKISGDGASTNGSDQEGPGTSKGSKSSKLPKKRKATEEGASARKAPLKSNKMDDSLKKKDKNKKTEVKPKGPVDVERQCGVPLPQGGLCARSLTCKSHSMGSKRAVTGRSQPYDILLAQYQKKNHAKLSMSKHLGSYFMLVY